jgi:hypothetical protein
MPAKVLKPEGFEKPLVPIPEKTGQGVLHQHRGSSGQSRTQRHKNSNGHVADRHGCG